MMRRFIRIGVGIRCDMCRVSCLEGLYTDE